MKSGSPKEASRGCSSPAVPWGMGSLSSETPLCCWTSTSLSLVLPQWFCSEGLPGGQTSEPRMCVSSSKPSTPVRMQFVKNTPPTLSIFSPAPNKPSRSKTPEPSGDRVSFGSGSQLCFCIFRMRRADSRERSQAQAGRNPGQLRQTGSRHISFYLEIQVPHSSPRTERSAVYQIKSLSLSLSLKPNTLTWVLAVTLFN